MKWKNFEARVIKDANLDYGTVLYKYPERFQNVYSGKAKQVKSPFDCFGAIDGRCIFFDCKSIGKNNFKLSQKVFHKKKRHQWQALSMANEKDVKAGYLIHFYNIGIVAWASVESVRRAYNASEPNIAPEDLKCQPDTKPIVLRNLILDES